MSQPQGPPRSPLPSDECGSVCARRSGPRRARKIVVMDGVPRWRIGIDVRSPDVGAAVAFDQIVDFDDQPPLAVPGLVVVLSTWLWQEGLDTRWWLGAIVEARSATSAAERVASVVDARTRTAWVRTRTVTIHATA